MLNIKEKREYGRRRQQCMAAIGPESVALVFATSEKRRNADVDYLFRPNSDFVYLTGFHEPDALLVLAPGHASHEETLFVLPRDIAAEQWNGRRLGADRVKEMLGIESAFTVEEIRELLPNLLDGRDILHVVEDSETEPQVDVWIGATKAAGLRPPQDRASLADTLHELRIIKSEAEIERMLKAARISAAAHQRAMRFCRPGISELDLESELQHEFAMQGARFTAYPSIVASGTNACIMHYIQNDATIHDGDLVLIDAGCEYQYYASDITRTFPANGCYTSPQRDIYDLVLSAQLAAIEQVKTGHAFTDPHTTSTQILAEGLIDLGVLKGSIDEILENDLAKPFTVHRCSHFLGLDVHDVGKREIDGEDRTLEAGMVLTVEPGLYFGNAESMPDLDPTWHNMGIRIEDDVVVTESGNLVLSADVPKSASDIEALMAG